MQLNVLLRLMKGNVISAFQLFSEFVAELFVPRCSLIKYLLPVINSLCKLGAANNCTRPIAGPLGACSSLLSLMLCYSREALWY